MWAPLAEEQGVAIEVVDRGGAAAVAVPGALDQILDNYLDNAIAVAPPASTVEVVVDAPRSPAVIRVHVLDRGPGLSDEQLAHAFERFWRAADAGHDGSGIGLAIVAHLAATQRRHRLPAAPPRRRPRRQRRPSRAADEAIDCDRGCFMAIRSRNTHRSALRR